MYGLLSSLGVGRGTPFDPDDRMTAILKRAARTGRDQLLVSAFAGTRDDIRAWPDRRWEWAGLVADNADFETPAGLDLEARDRWFAQAIVASPAMFRRVEGGGSLYWLGARDNTGSYLDGGREYRVSIPLPVPGEPVLVDHDLRRRDPLAGGGRPGHGRAAVPVRVARPALLGHRGASLRATGPRRGRRRLVADDPGSWVVRLYPDLRARGSRVRRLLETRRFQGRPLTRPARLAAAATSAAGAAGAAGAGWSAGLGDLGVDTFLSSQARLARPANHPCLAEDTPEAVAGADDRLRAARGPRVAARSRSRAGRRGSRPRRTRSR